MVKYLKTSELKQLFNTMTELDRLTVSRSEGDLLKLVFEFKDGRTSLVTISIGGSE